MRRMSWDALWKSVLVGKGGEGGDSVPDEVPFIGHGSHSIDRPATGLEFKDAVRFVSFAAEVVYAVLLYRVVSPAGEESIAVRTPAGACAPGWCAAVGLDRGDGFLHSPIPDTQDAVLGCIEEGRLGLRGECGLVGFVGRRGC